MEPQAIIERLIAGEDPPFRPLVGERECPPDLLDLMEKCWAENADDRPTFANIRIIIRGIMK